MQALFIYLKIAQILLSSRQLAAKQTRITGMRQYLFGLAFIACLVLGLVGQANAAVWVGIPPWPMQRDVTFTQPLTLSAAQPRVGQAVVADYTIRNDGQTPIEFQRLGVAVRGPNCYNLSCASVVDFQMNSRMTLGVGKSFSYHQSRTFDAPGHYFAQVVYQSPQGNWFWLKSEASFDVQSSSGGATAGSSGGVQITQPIALESTTQRVNDVYYAKFTIRNDNPFAITFKKIGVAVRGPDCETRTMHCNKIHDFPYEDNVTIPAGGTYSYRHWQQITRSGSFFMQIATQDTAHRWGFLGETTDFSVQPDPNIQRKTPLRLAAHYHPLWNDGDSARLALAKSAGLSLVRVAVEWRRLQPHGGGEFEAWYSGVLADFLDRANREGVQVYLMVAGSPCWASADPHKNCNINRYNHAYPPSNPYFYANMMSELVRRHGNQVVAWEIWNEPNIGRFWTNPDPVAYSNLLKAAYPAIKAQKGNAVVLGGALAGTDFAFLQGMYAQNANHFYDALSVHPYVKGSPTDCSIYLWSFYCGVEGFRAMMLHNRDYKPMWFTEFGWSSSLVGEHNQAQYLQQSIATMNKWDFVPVATWYNLVDNVNSGASHPEQYMGLFRPNGQAKPVASWLKNR